MNKVVNNNIELYFLLFREFNIDIQVIDFSEQKWEAIHLYCIEQGLYSLYCFAVMCERAGLIKILSNSKGLLDEIREEA